MNAKELNNAIAGQTVTRVEEGRTPGWMLIHFSNGMFLTITVDAPAKTDEEMHFAQCSLHEDNWRYGVRDHRLSA